MKLVIYKSGSEYPIEIAAKSTMLHVLLMMRATYPDTFKDKYVKIYKNKKKKCKISIIFPITNTILLLFLGFA